MNEIEFKLDGRTVTARPGETILQVAEANGIAIPSLCYHQKTSRNTSCLVCMVKDLKTGRFIPSCTACPAPGQEVDASSAEVQEMRKTALELLLSEHSGDCEAPCTMACPAHARVEEYVRAAKRGDFHEALRIIKERIPLPMSIGRVCPRFCEKECRRNLYGEPVAINDFKRLAADLCYAGYVEQLAPETGKHVAVVGAGPAGLGTAYFLRLKGIAVTVFDQMPEPGGMLRYGIPEYRLPKKAVLAPELAHFEKLGVHFAFNRRLGADLKLEELQRDFDAVVLAVGCWTASGMRCAGEELARQGIDFLREVAEGRAAANPGRVIVVGGGNTAMDCVRTAVRLGAERVQCFYRRTEKEMPAEKIEIKEAREEGVEFEFLVAPTALRRGEKGLILTGQRMELGEPDASGRRKPVPVPGSEFEVEADLVIAAIGQGVAAGPYPLNRFRTIDADPETGRVNGAEQLYSCGDCVSGAATVVEAVAGARRVAGSIVEDLLGEKPERECTVNVSRGNWRSMAPEEVVCLKPLSPDARTPQRLIPLAERKTTFKEVAQTFTEEEIAREGERCIECSCTAKQDCRLREVSCRCGADPAAIHGEKLPVVYDNRHPAIIHDRGKCIKCGICVKICKEVVNRSLLSPKKRGFNTYVAAAFDRTLPESCAECGACIRECPVGALDWKNKA